MGEPQQRPSWWRRLGADGRKRAVRVRLEAIFAAQSGVAAGAAWFVANDLLGHVRPFFAPISAVVVLSAAAAQRWRRAWELAFGVALGIGVGDALILVIGVGPVQIAAVVALAILTAGFLGGGGVAVGQAASSAVLVATLAPPTNGIYFGRFVDALIGGIIGLLVMNLLLPFNPLTRVRRAAGAALGVLAGALTQASMALRRRAPELAEEALQKLRASDSAHVNLRDSIMIGRETATLAPLRWSSRPALALYTEAAVHIERATRNVRVMQRRVAAVLNDDEPVPAGLADALDALAEAVTTLQAELADSRDPARARDRTLAAVHAAATAYEAGVGFSGSVVVAQIRSAAVDLLCATGLEHRYATRQVRRAARTQGHG